METDRAGDAQGDAPQARATRRAGALDQGTVSGAVPELDRRVVRCHQLLGVERLDARQLAQELVGLAAPAHCGRVRFGR
jgi:hypothetical protein